MELAFEDTKGYELTELARLIQCAPTARITSGGLTSTQRVVD